MSFLSLAAYAHVILISSVENLEDISKPQVSLLEQKDSSIHSGFNRNFLPPFELNKTGRKLYNFRSCGSKSVTCSSDILAKHSVLDGGEDLGSITRTAEASSS